MFTLVILEGFEQYFSFYNAILANIDIIRVIHAFLGSHIFIHFFVRSKFAVITVVGGAKTNTSRGDFLRSDWLTGRQNYLTKWRIKPEQICVWSSD